MSTTYNIGRGFAAIDDSLPNQRLADIYANQGWAYIDILFDIQWNTLPAGVAAGLFVYAAGISTGGLESLPNGAAGPYGNDFATFPQEYMVTGNPGGGSGLIESTGEPPLANHALAEITGWARIGLPSGVGQWALYSHIARPSGTTVEVYGTYQGTVTFYADSEMPSTAAFGGCSANATGEASTANAPMVAGIESGSYNYQSTTPTTGVTASTKLWTPATISAMNTAILSGSNYSLPSVPSQDVSTCPPPAGGMFNMQQPDASCPAFKPRYWQLVPDRLNFSGSWDTGAPYTATSAMFMGAYDNDPAGDYRQPVTVAPTQPTLIPWTGYYIVRCVFTIQWQIDVYDWFDGSVIDPTLIPVVMRVVTPAAYDNTPQWPFSGGNDIFNLDWFYNPCYNSDVAGPAAYLPSTSGLQIGVGGVHFPGSTREPVTCWLPNHGSGQASFDFFAAECWTTIGLGPVNGVYTFPPGSYVALQFLDGQNGNFNIQAQAEFHYGFLH